MVPQCLQPYDMMIFLTTLAIMFTHIFISAFRPDMNVYLIHKIKIENVFCDFMTRDEYFVVTLTYCQHFFLKSKISKAFLI